MNAAEPPERPLAPGKAVVHVDADFEALIPKFMVNRRGEVQAMREALSRQDFESLCKIAHGMKGTGGSYGFDDLTTMAATLEQAAKVKDLATVTQTLNAIATYLESVEVVYD
ncbi:MAG: hypothetical protein RL042_1256 [Nitrospirota bacterium]|jgi:HPt (histidine-containing phosphotransfer) domain-containing protein